MKTTKLPDDHCPYCGTLLRAATSAIGDHEPQFGAPTLCIGCGYVLIFTEENRVREPHPGEIEEMCEQQPGLLAEIAKVQLAIRLVKEEHAKRN